MKTYELYLSKLNPNVNYLWQRAKKSFDPINDQSWFDAAPIGRDPLNWHMKILSEKAKLSQVYTNHCIRATVVTNLDQQGFEARDIMATTGHKSESSIRSYASKCPPKKRRMISDALASTMNTDRGNEKGKITKSPKKALAPVSIATKNQEAKIVQPNFAVDNPPIMDIFPTFEQDDDIPDDEILDVLTQIENNNAEFVPTIAENTPKTVNVSAVSNIANVTRNPMMMPRMYFPHSNVTIHYNFSSK